MKAADSMTEAQWQSQVVALARQFSWECFHAPDNRPGRNGRVQSVTAGWPDLCLLGNGRALFVELKRESGKATPAQLGTLARLHDAGCEVALWRPSDLPQVLAALGPRQERLVYRKAQS